MTPPSAGLPTPSAAPRERDEKEAPYRSVLVTGAGGYIGRQLIEALARAPGELRTIVAADVRAPAERLPGVEYASADICTADLAELCARHAVDVVVHLAAIVTPDAHTDRAREYQVDVVGTRKVLDACLRTGVRKLVYTSSGAAYGYHADNPEWLDEDAPLRGNPEFAYSDHKRQVEEMLAAARREHPELRQLVFRPGTILGARADNQITAMFRKPWVLGLGGAATPFVLVWDQDVVAAILRGLREGGCGVYNLAGDGTLSLREMAQRLGKPYVALPPWLVAAGLGALHRLGLTRYGPEQVGFLRYRPVLANRRLKEEFGFTPRKTTAEVFDAYLEGQGHERPARV